MDTETPRRIRQLNFNGSGEQLEHLFYILHPSSTSVTSSIRLSNTPNADPREHFIRFLPLSFPKLSKLDINNFFLDSSSSLFTTSNLTSLKLSLPADDKPRYTGAQLWVILQRHQNLRELYMRGGAMPLVELSRVPVSVALPRLVDLRLYGKAAIVARFVDLVGMASPLRNFIIHFQYAHGLTTPAFLGSLKRILKAYYGCPELDHPRTINRLTVSSDPLRSVLVLDAESRSTPASHLKLQFRGIRNAAVEEIVPIFPLGRVREFIAEGLELVADDWRKVLRKTKRLLHLRLDNLEIGPVLDALDICDGGAYVEATKIILNRSHVDS
jgi:hypothetical protein